MTLQISHAVLQAISFEEFVIVNCAPKIAYRETYIKLTFSNDLVLPVYPCGKMPTGSCLANASQHWKIASKPSKKKISRKLMPSSRV